jgi:hypothetical protein
MRYAKICEIEKKGGITFKTYVCVTVKTHFYKSQD